MIYVASPYSGTPEEMQSRYEQVRDWIARNQPQYEEVLYSPIVHYHDIAITHDLPTNWEWWWNINRQMLEVSDSLLVLKLDGWQDSKGVARELDYAKEQQKDVDFVRPFEV